MKKISLFFIFFILVNLFQGCDRSYPPKEKEVDNVTIGIGTWAGFATGFVGMEKGFFQKITVETTILDDNAARHAAFQSGSLDIMISSIDVFSQEVFQGIEGKIFLVTDESRGADGIVAKTSIKNPENLKGKKIAYARGTPSQYFLYKVLEKNGLTLKDIEHVRVDDPGRAGDAFLSGHIDAAVTWEPFLTQLAESGKGHILATTKDISEAIVAVLVGSESFLGKKDLLQRFLDGWLETVDYIKQNPGEASKIMAKGLNLPVEDMTGMMSGLKFSDRKRNQYFFDNIQPAKTHLAKSLSGAGIYWKSVGIINKPLNASRLVSSFSCDYFN